MRILPWFVIALVGAASPAVAQQAALPGVISIKPAQGPGEVAKRAPVNGVLVLYGNERCPTDTSGDEIVVCERRGAEEQFRVPKELRNFQVTPENSAWAVKQKALLATGGPGANGTGSCSVNGAGGASGCMTGQFAEARAANAERKAAQAEGN
ncbi:hypothetical protein [Sphingomonas bacterium]|uniref:hypothetical protein n=1 Tax=Sphingomonas bacterium TaxID=1895847 RepID=UPI0015752276|nr:hypothetical protein [Sphingomonas bacterium]